MRTRFFYQIPTGLWLYRIDTESPMTDSQARRSAAEGFGIPPTDIGVVNTREAVDHEALRTAQDWLGSPPSLPTASAGPGSGLLRPTPPTVTPTPLAQALAQLRQATTTAEAVAATAKAIEELAGGRR